MKGELTITPEQLDILEEAIKTYGIRNQIDIAIEEMSELTKALSKLKRYTSGEAWQEPQLGNVTEEMADVQIMLIQLMDIFNSVNDMQRAMDYKVRRLKSRMENEKEEQNDDRRN